MSSKTHRVAFLQSFHSASNGINAREAAKALIDKLLNCPMKPNDSVRKEIIGSAKQINWITGTLLAERGLTNETDIKSLYTRCDYQARNIISELLAMPKVDLHGEVLGDGESRYVDLVCKTESLHLDRFGF